MRIRAAASLILIVAGCQDLEGVPWHDDAPGLFTEAAEPARLDIPGRKSGGLVWADFNNDGWLDVVVNTGDSGLGTRLLFSDGLGPDPAFNDVTQTHAAGLSLSTSNRSVIAADFNHDGFVDILRNSNSAEGYLNRGPTSDPPFSFGDPDGGAPDFVWADLGVVGGGNTEGFGLLDFNEDGWLDVVVERSPNATASTIFVVMQNPADGTLAFTAPDVSALFPVRTYGGGDFLTVTDYNRDGFVDFIVRHNNHEDLWRNDGAGLWSAHGFDANAPGGNKGGVIFCDFNEDGVFDMFWTDGGFEGNVVVADNNQVLLQDDNENFIASGEPQNGPWGLIDGLECGDIDHDGDQDLYLVSDGRDFLYRNELRETGTFGLTLAYEDIDAREDGASVAFADYDRDGDLDLYVNQNNENELYRNERNTNDYLMVRVLVETATGTTRSDVGALVQLYDGGNPVTGIREVNGGKGHGSMKTGMVHFGLPGGANRDYELSIRFQSSAVHTDPVFVPVNPSTLGDYQLIEVLDTQVAASQ